MGKYPTPEGKISIVLFTRLAEIENDFSPILYQSKKCGHRIHVLFMMYDVY
jgi:hypothetical protein